MLEVDSTIGVARIINNTCSNARTAVAYYMQIAYYIQIYETKCGYIVFLFHINCLV